MSKIVPVKKGKAYARALPSSGLMIRITAVARGEVQGVGYRYFVTGCARAAGVTGYVKNKPDGKG